MIVLSPSFLASCVNGYPGLWLLPFFSSLTVDQRISSLSSPQSSEQVSSHMLCQKPEALNGMLCAGTGIGGTISPDTSLTQLKIELGF